MVPRAFVWVDRAEQTIATRELGRYDLIREGQTVSRNDGRKKTLSTHSTMWLMLSNDLPTLVPPYFCTTHGTLSSAEFRNSSSAGLVNELDSDAVELMVE